MPMTFVRKGASVYSSVSYILVKDVYLSMLTMEMTPGPQAYSNILISRPRPASVSVHLSLIHFRWLSVCSESVFMALAKRSLYAVASWLG